MQLASQGRRQETGNLLKMKIRLAAGLLVLATTTAGVTQASADIRRPHPVVKAAHAPRQAPIERTEAIASDKRRWARRAGLRGDIRPAERERGRHRRTVDAEDRRSGQPGRPLMVHADGDEPTIVMADETPGLRIVAEARRWIGTNPTQRATLWCARFMNFVLEQVGLPGT